MTPTPRLISEFVFDSTFTVDTVELLADDGGVQRYKLISCKPSYGYIGGSCNELPIIEIGTNYIVVRSETLLVKGDYTLNLPFFLHGTQKAIKIQIESVMRSNMQYPFIYMQEPFKDKVMIDKTSSHGVVSDLRVWFLLPHDRNSLVTSDIYDRNINALNELALRWLKQIQRFKYFDFIGEDYDVTYHTNVGSTSEYGYLYDLFNTPMSGVELRFKLPVLKQFCRC